jgi:multidrug resistance protein MdtO
MAATAIELSARWRILWRSLGKASPERLEFTTRLALICALTTLITEIFQTPEPALTAYVAFFLNRRERTTSLILSVALTVVVSIVVGLLFLVARLVVDDPLWRVSSIALLSFVLLFLASASKLHPVAGTVAQVVGYALYFLGTVQIGEEATRALLYAWLFVAIPAGVSLIVNLSFAPAPARVAERALGECLRQSAALLRKPESSAIRQAFRKCAKTGVAQIRADLELAGVEKSASAHQLGALRQAALSTTGLMSALDVFVSNPELQIPRATRQAIAATLDDMATILASGGYPVQVDPSWTENRELNPVAERILAKIREAISLFAEPAGAPTVAPPGTKGFFVADAFTNPEHVQYALKTTGAAVFCYCLYSLLNWPGIHTCFLTCYIVAQSTAAESVEKLMLRIVGCLLGAAAGITAIVYLVPFLTSIGGLLIAVFVGAWVAGYVAAGSPRISYAGFQIAFAFFLCLIQGAGPQFDLEIARDRIIGILIGNMVAYVAIVHIWPISICRRIDPALVHVLKRLRELFLGKDVRDQQLIATELNSTLAAVNTDLALARYEPISIRASDTWLGNRRALAEQFRSLGALFVLLGQSQDDASRGFISRRLESLAAELATFNDPNPSPQRAPTVITPCITLPELIKERLDRLEDFLNSRVSDAEADTHAHA